MTGSKGTSETRFEKKKKKGRTPEKEEKSAGPRYERASFKYPPMRGVPWERLQMVVRIDEEKKLTFAYVQAV
jgi:hypothetical protein